MFRLVVWFRDRHNQFWVAPVLSVVFAVLTCTVVALIDHYVTIPDLPVISYEALDSLLSTVSSSMLAVATFSLGIVVSATGAVASGATPRATKLVMGDPGARRAIGSFIGAFVYAVVAKTALSFGIYQDLGQLLLLIATLFVLGNLVVRLVLWVRTALIIGQLNDTLIRMEKTARKVLEEHVKYPYLGACPGTQDASMPVAHTVYSDATGYVTYIDLTELNLVAKFLGTTIHVQYRPGSFISPTMPLALVESTRRDRETLVSEAELKARIRGAFLIDSARSYDQDPRYGLLAFSEVAQRALSPAVNDPGTAIQVVSITTALLVDTSLHATDVARDVNTFPYLTVPELSDAVLVADGFSAIARDGAGNVDVAVRIQKLLAIVAASGSETMRKEACRQANYALEHSLLEMKSATDRTTVQTAHQQHFTERRP